MKYSKELHERVLQRIHDQGEVISFGTPFVESLLEEISRLQAENKQYQNIFDIQKMTIERLQAERRWIPESGAPINRRVYVLMPNNYVVIATKFKSLCKDPNHYLWRNDSGAICQVICWMPLPEPTDAS